MSLVYYPHPVFRQKAHHVTVFDHAVAQDIHTMESVMAQHHALGIGANMCGILKRIIIAPLVNEAPAIPMINPEIIFRSDKLQQFTEASLSLPSIEAIIERPQTITLNYQDQDQKQHQATVTDFAATIIQHEIDYLDGIIFLDYLSKTKAKLLKEKLRKYLNKKIHLK